MAENSKIPWTDDTFNPWVGCQKVSPACDNCYAEGWANRCGRPGLWGGALQRTTDANWKQPLKWNRKAEKDGQRRRVFCASLADVFDDRVPWQWRKDLWTLICDTPWLDWLILTKRPENFADMLPGNFPEGMPNVWLGVTVENKETAKKRIPVLLNTPASHRFLSCEPLLEDIAPSERIYDWLDGLINLVIVGGESGGSARMMQDQWAEHLLQQCRRDRVPFFMKQMGAVNDRISKNSGIEEDDTWGYIPPGLRVREFPGYIEA